MCFFMLHIVQFQLGCWEEFFKQPLEVFQVPQQKRGLRLE